MASQYGPPVCLCAIREQTIYDHPCLTDVVIVQLHSLVGLYRLAWVQG